MKKLKIKRRQSDNQQVNDPKENELTLYFTAGIISGKEDPIMSWKDNRDQLPPPTKLAREYLAILAMSTPSEKHFSLVVTLVDKEGVG